MKIPLATWAARHYSPAPSIRTLRAWAATGQLFPPPEKVGRSYMVEERAVRLQLNDDDAANTASITLSDRAQSILRAA